MLRPKELKKLNKKAQHSKTWLLLHNKHAQKGGLIEDISCHGSLLEAGLFFDKHAWFLIIVASIFYPPQITSDHVSMLIRIQLLCKTLSAFES